MLCRLITFGEVSGIPPASCPVAYDVAKQLNAAAAKLVKHEFAAQWAGQGAPLARELPAEALVGLLVEESRNTP